MQVSLFVPHSISHNSAPCVQSDTQRDNIYCSVAVLTVDPCGGWVSSCRRCDRVFAMQEIDMSSTLIEPLASDSDSETSTDSHDDRAPGPAQESTEQESANSIQARRAPRETMSFSVNVLFDNLFDESDIRLTANQQIAEPGSFPTGLDQRSREQNCGPENESNTPRNGEMGTLATVQSLNEKGKMAKQLLTLSAELLSGEPEEPPSTFVRSVPISGRLINPRLVQAIQEDLAHVFSEHCKYVKPTNRVRPYHVDVVSLTELPSRESARELCAPSDSLLRESSAGQLQQQKTQALVVKEKVQALAAAGHTRYELMLSVVLPRGVPTQSVQEVVREQVHDVNSVWRREAPPFYSLDPDYIRDANVASVDPVTTKSDDMSKRRETEEKISEGLPPLHCQRSETSIEQIEQIEQIENVRSCATLCGDVHEQRRWEDDTDEDAHEVGDGDRGRTQVDAPGRIPPIPSKHLVCATQSDISESSSGETDDSDISDEEDDEEETPGYENEDEGYEGFTDDPATQAFAAAIDRGSSAIDACIIGLEVICTLLRGGGVPEAALESLHERATAAFHHACIKGSSPLEAWQLVGESAESGDLF